MPTSRRRPSRRPAGAAGRGELARRGQPAAASRRPPASDRFPPLRLNHYRAGTGEPLLLIHGIGSRWQMWKPVIDRLLSRREVIAIDLPGFAGSPMPAAGTPAGIGTLTSLVRGFLDEQGIQQPHVGGNSLGGWLALELAKQGVARSVIARAAIESPFR